MVSSFREFFIDLSPDLRIRVRRSQPPPPLSYAITLEVLDLGKWSTVRLWDNADGIDLHHEHSHTRSGGKQPPIVHDFPTPNDAIAAAIEQAKLRADAIVGQWRSS